MSDIDITEVSGPALKPRIPDLARLRMTVFRAYPYLYDGTEAYEESYLDTYTASGKAVAILATADGRIVGAATGIPMAHETEAFKAPFRERDLDPEKVFYFGESVLLPEYRGLGIYRHFMSGREAYARRLGDFSHSCFCAVIRPDDHPLRPADYSPLDAVWKHFGYRPVETLVTRFRWKDIDQPAETDHEMMFWIKPL